MTTDKIKRKYVKPTVVTAELQHYTMLLTVSDPEQKRGASKQSYESEEW